MGWGSELEMGLAHNHRFLISRCPVPQIQLARVVIGWDAHVVSHQGVGLFESRESHWICESATVGGGVVPTVFWGKLTCQGRERIPLQGSLHDLEPDG